MRREIRLALSAIMLVWGGCGASAPPLRYIAVERPESVPASQQSAAAAVERSRVDWGGVYRSPQDARSMLQALQQKVGSPVLQDADLRLQVPICYLVVCVGTDVATTGKRP